MLELSPHKVDCVFGAIKLLSKRTFEYLVDARALLSDWHGLNHATHWPPIPYPLVFALAENQLCLLYTSPSPRDLSTSRMPSSA